MCRRRCRCCSIAPAAARSTSTMGSGRRGNIRRISARPAGTIGGRSTSPPSVYRRHFPSEPSTPPATQTSPPLAARGPRHPLWLASFLVAQRDRETQGLSLSQNREPHTMTNQAPNPLPATLPAGTRTTGGCVAESEVRLTDGRYRGTWSGPNGTAAYLGDAATTIIVWSSYKPAEAPKLCALSGDGRHLLDCRTERCCY